MDIPLIRPKALKPGDTIAIVAPAGTVTQRDDFHRGVAALERMGFRVRYEERIFHTLRYLAGTDEERAEELMHSFEDPEVQAIVSLRGGYGCARLLALLDPERLVGRCKIFMGFSDLTTLHLFFRRSFGWVTFHGPMATSPALGNIGQAPEEHLLSLWTNPEYLASYMFPDLETWAPGTAEGELIGGCLSLIAASLGTPYELDTKEKILFLEDLGEPPYRIDRMLTQLRLARKLDGIAGLLLGSFQDCEPAEESYTLEETLKDLLQDLQVPVIAKFPSGHGTDNWVLPLGTRVRLDASSRRIQCLQSAVDR
jgi:muramoyltetrapeptide carboxypeptidase